MHPRLSHHQSDAGICFSPFFKCCKCYKWNDVWMFEYCTCPTCPASVTVVGTPLRGTSPVFPPIIGIHPTLIQLHTMECGSLSLPSTDYDMSVVFFPTPYEIWWLSLHMYIWHSLTHTLGHYMLALPYKKLLKCPLHTGKLQRDSRVKQPGTECLVTCNKVMEYDYACNNWHHWSSLMTQSLTVLWGNQAATSSALCMIAVCCFLRHNMC